MVDKQLVDWIRSQETHGYSEDELKKHLMKYGYINKEIKEAFKAKSEPRILIFSLADYINSLSIAIFILFLASFVFFYHYLGLLDKGIIFLVTLLALSILLNVAYKKSLKIAKILTVLNLIFPLLLCFIILDELANILLFFIPFSIALISSLLYYFKSNKLYHIESVFLTFFISVVFSCTIDAMISIAFAYKVLPLMGTIRVSLLPLILSPFILIFTFSYLLISILLLRKTFGEFQYNAFFRCTFFPFSILNLLSSKNRRSVMKPVIWTSLIVFILFLALSSTLSCLIGIRYVENSYSQIIENREELLSELIHQIWERYDTIINIKGYNRTGIQGEITEDEGVFKYSIPLNDVDIVLYNCDGNLECESRALNISAKLEDQVPLRDSDGYLVVKNNSKHLLYIIHLEALQSFINHYDIFEFENQELRRTKIARRINQELQESYKGIINTNVDAPSNVKEKIQYFYSGRVSGDILKNAVSNQAHIFNLQAANQAKRICINEYEWIGLNELNNTIFYDEALTQDQHIQNLSRNIAYFYPRLSAWIEKEKNMLTLDDSSINSAHGAFYLRVMQRISDSLDISRDNKEFTNILRNHAFNLSLDYVNKYYDLKELDWSAVDKILRLKIAETRLANRIIGLCEDDECRMEIIALTIDTRDECEYISDNILRSQCLNVSISLTHIGRTELDTMNKEQCTKKGYDWIHLPGMCGEKGCGYRCDIKTRDAGKRCNSNSECEGVCLCTELKRDYEDYLVGKCSKYKYFTDVSDCPCILTTKTKTQNNLYPYGCQ